MYKIFLYLLNKYSRREEGRLLIFNKLHKSVIAEYSEQSPFGNVYNSYIEFIMSNDTITHFVKNDDINSIDTVKRGLNNEFGDAINYIKEEKLKIYG